MSDEAREAIKRLEELTDLRALKRGEKACLNKEAVPANVRTALDEIAAEFDPQIEALSVAIEEVETEVRELVRARGESLKGQSLHAVFSPGGVKWDADRLEGYAAAHPEIRACCIPKPATVQIRQAK